MKGLFSRLFGKRAAPARDLASPGAPARDVAALVAPLRTPALHVRGSNGPSRSHLGGQPALPPGVAWPQLRGKPLEFLARLSLAQMRQSLALPWLPDSGALLFFYDLDGQPWGFDPAHREGHAVLYVPDLDGPAAPPSAGSAALPFIPLEFRAISVLPDGARPVMAELGLSDDEYEQCHELAQMPFQELPQHQVGGFPDPIQGDGMELECQLASHGIYCGDPSGYDSAAAAQLADGADNWKLLLQLDDDARLGLELGDCGRLYFWVEEQRARAGQFDRTCVILQCF